jgi:transposase-like protein
MYSYEDRIRAVELYIKLGKRVRPTIRQLGYPTTNSLKGWFREYEQRLDLPAGYAGREPKFSPAQKAAAIKHYLTHDRCIAATMRALGYLSVVQRTTTAHGASKKSVRRSFCRSPAGCCTEGSPNKNLWWQWPASWACRGSARQAAFELKMHS